MINLKDSNNRANSKQEDWNTAKRNITKLSLYILYKINQISNLMKPSNYPSTNEDKQVDMSGPPHLLRVKLINLKLGKATQKKISKNKTAKKNP